MTTSNADAPPAQPVWSPEVRTWVSLLLFVHLFAVVVAVTAYTRPSGMQEQLHALFAPYLRQLHLTAFPVSYPYARFHLTHAGASDMDYSIEVDVKGKDGAQDKVTIPSADLFPAVRARRYQALANAMGTLTTGEAEGEFSSLLPRAVAGSILKQQGAKQGTLKCRAHFLPDIDVMGETESGRQEVLEDYRDTYEATVFITPGGVELLKKSATLEVAPVEGKAKP